jgi:hypothetical protein
VRPDENVLRATTFREVKCRQQLSKDRVLNLMTAIERLQAVIPDNDPRMAHILDLASQLFSDVKNALIIEEKLEAEILKLAVEVGRFK